MLFGFAQQHVNEEKVGNGMIYKYCVGMSAIFPLPIQVSTIRMANGDNELHML